MKKEDLRQVFPLGKYLPIQLMESAVAFLPPQKSFTSVSHFDIFDKAEGWMVGVALTPQQMINLPKEKVRAKVLEAVLFSQERLGADLLMLGAYASPLTSAGLWLKEQPKVKLNITNGNTFTAAVSIETTEKAARLAGFNLSRIKMAIVGAAGAIGEVISKHFNQKGVNLILVERTDEKFERLRPYLVGQNYKLTCDLNDIVEADLIVTATSHPSALIRPEILKEKAIVVDVAEPPDVPADINEKRPDVICIDGGRVKVEGVDLGINLGLPKNVIFACMAEVILQALEEKRESYVGSVDLNHLKETQEWAKKWGFSLADFTFLNKPVPLEKFKE